MRTKILNELKKAFEPYSLLWEEWTNSNFCSLAKEEIYLINIHVKNNFQVNISEFIMFYNKIELLQQAIQNLKLYYREFQEWALLKFAHDILNLTSTENINSFIETPINELPIGSELKQSLKNFNRKNLKQIFLTYTDADLKKEKVFRNIVEYRTACKQINGLTHNKISSTKNNDTLTLN